MEDLKSELLALERRYWKAIKDKDLNTIATLTDETCLIAGPRGSEVMTKEQMIEMMRKSIWDDKTYVLHDFDLPETSFIIHEISDTLAIVAYGAHEKITVEGKNLELDVVDSSVWIERDGNWVCAGHTEALRGDMYGRDNQPAKAAA